MPPESTFTSPTMECPHPELWTARDAGASEDEVHQFLAALIRLVKPLTVIETGCYLGGATWEMAQALQWNHRGYLDSCDVDPQYAASVATQCSGLPATIHSLSGVELISKFDLIDFAFIDSGEQRIEEAKLVKEKLSSYGLVAFHDSRWQGWTEVKNLGWKELFFPCPRGLSLFQN